MRDSIQKFSTCEIIMNDAWNAQLVQWVWLYKDIVQIRDSSRNLSVNENVMNDAWNAYFMQCFTIGTDKDGKRIDEMTHDARN